MTRLQWQALFRRSKLTQRSLAKEAGVAPPTISQFIRGKIVSRPLQEFFQRKFGEEILKGGNNRLQ